MTIMHFRHTSLVYFFIASVIFVLTTDTYGMSLSPHELMASKIARVLLTAFWLIVFFGICRIRHINLPAQVFFTHGLAGAVVPALVWLACLGTLAYTAIRQLENDSSTYSYYSEMYELYGYITSALTYTVINALYSSLFQRIWLSAVFGVFFFLVQLVVDAVVLAPLTHFSFKM